MIEVLKQALEALKDVGVLTDREWQAVHKNKANELRQAIAELESQEPVAHSVIAGVLFDFMGWLTSRKKRIVLSSADNASPAVEAITEFAKMRGLSLDDAKVQDWHTHPPQRTWVGLTNEEIDSYFEDHGYSPSEGYYPVIKDVEAKFKENNG